MKKLLGKINEKVNVVFLVFTFSIFIKCVIFHYSCFGYVAGSSLWQNPFEFFAFYFAKLLPALFFGSFVFLAKRQWWTIIVSVVVDFWLIANLLYYRQCSLFMDIDVIMMAGNLNGFMSSILTYINWQVFLFPIISIIYCVVLLLLRKQKVSNRFVKRFIIVMTTCLLLVGYDFLLGYGSDIVCKGRDRQWYDINQFQWGWKVAKGKSLWSDLQRPNIVERGTVFHYFPTLCIYELSRDRNKKVEFSERELSLLDSLVSDSNPNESPNGNMIFILVESFESWTLEMKDMKGSYVTPNINDFIKKHAQLYCSKIKSQTRNGGSGDGQMIENTGMLPLNSGAACMLYGKNIYPNYAHLFNNSIIIDPCANGIWNQPEMTKSYGYRDIYPNSKNGMEGTEDDMVVFSYASKHLDKLKDGTFCMHIITMSMHTPFTRVDCPSMLWPDDMPLTLKRYLNAVHYMDSSLSPFLSKIESDSLLKNTSLFITGDHNVFHSNKLKEFADFAKKYDYPVPSRESYCPLIIYSPTITDRVDIHDLSYQMDIFPTILHCIGVDNYYWKGFGVNLLDSVARNNRIITEDEAYRLSDKMIRSDWFRTHGK